MISEVRTLGFSVWVVFVAIFLSILGLGLWHLIFIGRFIGPSGLGLIARDQRWPEGTPPTAARGIILETNLLVSSVILLLLTSLERYFNTVNIFTKCHKINKFNQNICLRHVNYHYIIYLGFSYLSCVTAFCLCVWIFFVNSIFKLEFAYTNGSFEPIEMRNVENYLFHSSCEIDLVGSLVNASLSIVVLK